MIPDSVRRRGPVVRLARRNITRTPVRSGLAALGITIGVIAIASLGMLGTTLEHAATQSLGELGTQVLVTPAFSAGVEELTARDVRRIDRASVGAAIVPTRQARVVVSIDGDRQVVRAYGVARPAGLYDAADGRIPTPLRSGILVGSDLADRFEIRSGNTVQIDAKTYRVRAVLARVDGLAALDPNAGLVLPPSAFERDGYDSVLVVAESGRGASRSATRIRERLNGRRTHVDVLELGRVVDRVGTFFDILDLVLVGIGSISLVVAGVSILNVMLLSTVERRAELGVLRAIGLGRRDVILLVLLEAMLVGLGGGAAGAVVSFLIGFLLASVTIGDPWLALDPSALRFVLAGVAFGLVTSAASSLYPAWSAATAPPVDALRE